MVSTSATNAEDHRFISQGDLLKICYRDLDCCPLTFIHYASDVDLLGEILVENILIVHKTVLLTRKPWNLKNRPHLL